jgi:DNA-binding XRE family transcriptional regulator
MITAAQLRAARGLLDWTRTELAKAANISPETVKNIEHGTFRPQETTAEAIIQAFRMHDVEFTENEGVRRRRDKVVTYEGVEGFKRFLDDVYQAAQDPSSAEGGDKPICLSNVDDRFFIKHLNDYSILHAKRVNELKHKVKVRILVKEKAFLKVSGVSYREYRVQPNMEEGNVPFYVYGDKLAVLIFDEEHDPQIVVIASPLVAKAYRSQFEVLWKNAKTLDAKDLLSA